MQLYFKEHTAGLYRPIVAKTHFVNINSQLAVRQKVDNHKTINVPIPAFRPVIEAADTTRAKTTTKAKTRQTKNKKTIIILEVNASTGEIILTAEEIEKRRKKEGQKRARSPISYHQDSIPYSNTGFSLTNWDCINRFSKARVASGGMNKKY